MKGFRINNKTIYIILLLIGIFIFLNAYKEASEYDLDFSEVKVTQPKQRSSKVSNVTINLELFEDDKFKNLKLGGVYKEIDYKVGKKNPFIE